MTSTDARAGRRLMIADAALKMLALHGAHGVTHRKIDRELGLPEGSTSYYFRKRSDLLVSAYERLADSVLSDMNWIDTTDPELALERLTDTVMDWVSPTKRDRMVAILELLLEGGRSPEVSRIMEQIWERVTERNRALYRILGTGGNLAEMEPFRAMLVGLMMRAALRDVTQLPRDELKSLLRDTFEFLAQRAKRRQHLESRDAPRG